MKRYIRAMSFTRSQALSKISALSSTLDEHVIKCIVYVPILPDQLDHWTEEIGIYLYNTNKIKSKTKLKDLDYINSIFASFGSDKDDAEANLRLFKIHNNKYPDFEIDSDLITSLFNAYTQLVNTCIPLFISGTVKSISEWIQIVRTILK